MSKLNLKKITWDYYFFYICLMAISYNCVTICFIYFLSNNSVMCIPQKPCYYNIFIMVEEENSRESNHQAVFQKNE